MTNAVGTTALQGTELRQKKASNVEKMKEMKIYDRGQPLSLPGWLD